jgi:hypothetical protein
MFLIPAVIYLLTSLILVLISRFWPGFGQHWLVVAGGGLLAWLGGLLVLILVPLPLDWSAWPAQELLDPALTFGWDHQSWAYALAISSFGLAVILTDVERARERVWTAWAISHLITGLGILAAFASNIFTFLLLFSALDLALLLAVWVRRTDESDLISRIAGPFSIRLLSLGLLIFSMLIGPAFTNPGSPSGSGWLQTALFFMGIFLRLVKLNPYPKDELDSLDAGFDFIPAAAALVLVPRWFAAASPPLFTLTILGTVVLLVGTLRALVWAVSETELKGRQDLLAATGALVMLAAFRGELQASANWGLVLLLSGGVFAIYRPSDRWLIVAPGVALIAITGLPLSPAWDAMGLYSQPLSPVFLLGLLVHGLLLTGLIRHLVREQHPRTSKERWEQLIYPLGLALPLIAQQLIAWVPEQAPGELYRYPWWPGLLAIGVGAAFWLWLRLGNTAAVLRAVFEAGAGVFAIGIRPLVGIPAVMRRVIDFLTTIMEGEGGVLWALLFLALIVSILIQLDLIGLLNGN